METENNVTELKTKKEPQYDDILMQSSGLFADKPVVIAMLNKDQVPMLQIGNFNVKDLTYLKYILNKHIDAALDRVIHSGK